MRRWLLIGLLLSVVSMTSRITAQDMTPWTAWLYNSNGTITRIASEGAVLQEIVLPVLPGQQPPRRVAVSRSGDFVAYASTNPMLNAHQIVIYDLVNNAQLSDNVSADTSANSLQRYTSPYQFDERDAAFAYGILPLDGLWRVRVMDTASGEIRAELRADDPALAGLDTDTGLLPVVTTLHNRRVYFALIDEATGSSYGTFAWRLDTNAITAEPPSAVLESDLFPPTGERILPVRDLNFPNIDATFALQGGQQNTLQVVDPSSGGRAPFFVSGDQTLAVPRFVQHGERVLTAALNSEGMATWRLIERNGAVVGEAALNIHDVYNLLDGFIYLTATNPAVLMVVNTRTGMSAGTPVGQGAPDAELQLAWAGNNAQPPSVSYIPWINLADSVSVSQATQVAVIDMGILPTLTPHPTEAQPEPTISDDPFFVAPTPNFLPTPQGFQSQLAIGDRARVTDAGHGAGLHRDPEMASPKYLLLYTHMVAEVLDGPMITDGYIWWRVRVESPSLGVHTGWAVEGADGAAWLATGN